MKLISNVNLFFLKPFLFSFIFIFFISSFSLGQNNTSTENYSLISKKVNEHKLLRKGRKYTDNGIYDKARANYLLLLSADSTNFNYNYELAMNYHENTVDCRSCAIPYFERAIRHFTADTIYDIYYYLASAYQFDERYDQAIAMYKKLLPYMKRDKFEKYLIDEYLYIPEDECNIAKQLVAKRNTAYTIVHLDSCVNDVYAEYVPLVTDNDSVMMFTSRKKTSKNGTVDINDGKFYEDMYVSTKVNGTFCKAEKFLSSESELGKKINNFTHDAVAWISYDGSKLITYKNEKIYLSEKINRRWAKPVLLPKAINMSDWQPSGCLSPDGNTLFFSSDETGGHGGLDLYKTTKQADGSWGIATNLGKEINTVNDEDSPNMWIDGKTLFFSSTSNSMGGYDVFMSKWLGDNEWSNPQNLGVPINSPGDDIFFIPNKNFTSGYFSSFRKDGYGDMDIYKYKYLPEGCVPFNNPEYASNVTYLQLTAPDTVSVNSEFDLSADRSQIKDEKISGYEWDFGDNTEGNGMQLRHSFNRAGNFCVNVIYTIDYSISKNNSDTLLPQIYHTSKKIVALAPKEFKVYADAKRQTEQAIERQNEISTSMALANAISHRKVNATNESKNDTENKNINASSASKSDSEKLENNNSHNSVANNSKNSKEKNSNNKTADGLAPTAVGGIHPGTLYYSKEDSTRVAKLNTLNLPDLNLEPIHFDLNKSDISDDEKTILDRNIEKLKAHSDIIIRISANTDARGKKEYNYVLAQDRAEAARKYMMKNGIKSGRLILVAFGEEHLLNNCGDEVKCDESEHRKNRRDEFVVLGTKK